MQTLIKKIRIMKKAFIIGAIAIGTIASAFPFRTSCGKVVSVSESITFHTNDTLQEALAQLNTMICGTPTKASQITIYSH